MAIYYNYCCPKCGKTLESLVPYRTKGVGMPFRICPFCDSPVLMKELFNEWELMSASEQRNMKRRPVYTAIQVGGVLSAVGGFLILGWLFPDLLKKDSGAIIFLCIAFFMFGAFVHYLFVKKGLKEDIEKSMIRMKDPNYLNILRKLGLIDN